MDSHLQSNMREHLEFACVQLKSTQVQLNEQRVQLNETGVQLDETRVQLDETRVQLDETRGQLDETRGQSDETRAQLDETRAQLAETQAKLSRLSVEDGGKTRFIWKIKSFRESLRLVKEGVKERIESDPFYTGRYGYKLKVFAQWRCHFLGLASSKRPIYIDTDFLTGIVLMEGEYDDMLPWPFNKKITFTIIDQNKDLKERQNMTDSLSPRSPEYFNDMIFSVRPGEKMKEVKSKLRVLTTHKILERRRYIVNNTLFLQVDVEPND